MTNASFSFCSCISKIWKLGIFDSSSQKTYQSLLDQEWSRKLSNNASFGIAEAIKLQFKNQMNALETKSDV